MKKIIGYYLAFLSFIDLGWAYLFSRFGGAVFTALGDFGHVSAQDKTGLSHAGTAVSFVVGLFQSFVFDFIFTVALIVAFGFYTVFSAFFKKG